jgi:hypothetical protein
MHWLHETRDRQITGYYLYTLLISLSFYTPVLVPFFTTCASALSSPGLDSLLLD